MDDETLILLCYITIAPNREKVLKSFEDEDFLRPIEISRKTGIHIHNVSKHLRSLREHGLVYVMNPEYPIPRLYRLTESCRNIVQLL